jgi:type II secretory ATPase GspE/PulE/Tfp pilus assembly ATPase PilB-like protein
VEGEPTEEELQLVGEREIDGFYRPVGCPQCLGNGYTGRIGLFECFWVDEAIRRQISSQASETEIIASAREKHRSMFADGLQKVSQGLTTLAEVVRVTRGEID